MFDWRKKYEDQMRLYNMEIDWDLIEYLPNGPQTFEDTIAQARLRIVDLVELVEDTSDPVEKMFHERDLVHLLVIDELGDRYEAITQLLQEV